MTAVNFKDNSVRHEMLPSKEEDPSLGTVGVVIAALQAYGILTHEGEVKSEIWDGWRLVLSQGDVRADVQE